MPKPISLPLGNVTLGTPLSLTKGALAKMIERRNIGSEMETF